MIPYLTTAFKHFAAQASRFAVKSIHVIMPHSIVDASLVSLGVAAAVGSMSFATVMLMQEAHAPLVNDMQFFALFAQPRSAPGGAKAPAAPTTAPDDAPQFANVDMTPTGSIDRSGGDAAESGRFRIVGGRPDVVYLSNGDALQSVRAGDTIAGLGEVASIAWRDGAWQLLDKNGRLLVAQEQAAISTDPTSAGRFSRGMIFGR